MPSKEKVINVPDDHQLFIKDDEQAPPLHQQMEQAIKEMLAGQQDPTFHQVNNAVLILAPHALDEYTAPQVYEVASQIIHQANQAHGSRNGPRVDPCRDLSNLLREIANWDPAQGMGTPFVRDRAC